MTEPTLVIMAAGLGSRFGGIKQLAAVDGQGSAIIDYSLFDARRAGFKKLVFIIRESIREDFVKTVGARAEKQFEVRYVLQELSSLPEGLKVPEGRVKPWGTGHAVMCCRGVVTGPFAVINADDFYGAGAFRTIYDFLAADRSPDEYAMVSYRLCNTVTDSGSVARGICSIEDGFLTGITERTRIYRRGGNAVYTEDGEHFTELPGDTAVSMNFWGFSQKMIDELYGRFPAFYEKAMVSDPLRAEYFLPFVADEQLKEGRCSVRVLTCGEVWHGMTYREDLENVRAAIETLHRQGRYPEKLYE